MYQSNAYAVFIRGCGGNPLSSQLTRAAICGALVMGMTSTMIKPAAAATEVQGNVDDLLLKAENVSTREVLDAIAAKFNLTYDLPPSIGRDVTGVYSGTLNQVLGRILDGNNYIVEASDSGVKLIVLGTSGATRRALSSPSTAIDEKPIAASVPPSKPNLPASQPVPPLISYLK
jgi:hypothetical protein